MDPISAVAGLAGGALGYFTARKAEKKANKRVRKARNEAKLQKEAFSAIDTSNPYLNMENTMEDLTVNTQAADMQAQQFVRISILFQNQNLIFLLSISFFV